MLLPIAGTVELKWVCELKSWRGLVAVPPPATPKLEEDP